MDLFERRKGCVRFKNLDDLPLDIIGEVIASITLKKYLSYIENWQRIRKDSRG